MGADDLLIPVRAVFGLSFVFSVMMMSRPPLQAVAVDEATAVEQQARRAIVTARPLRL